MGGMNLNLPSRLSELDLSLPPVPKAVADYIPAVRSGNLIYVSGQLPMRDGELIRTGSVPDEVTVEQAQACCRQCVLNGIAAVDQVLEGDWSRFVRVVRLGVFVSSGGGFSQAHLVANGGSELLGQVFGEAGRHIRAAVGASSLPLNAPVEAELLLEAR